MPSGFNEMPQGAHACGAIPTTLTPPGEQTGIMGGTEEIGKELEILKNHIQTLDNTLTPILSPSCPEKTNDQKEIPPSCELDAFMRGTYQKIENMVHHIATIQTRIRL